MGVAGHNMHAAGWKLRVSPQSIRLQASLQYEDRRTFQKEAKLPYCGGVLGVCQSIDDGAETALTGGLQDPVDFQGGGGGV